MKKLYVLKRSLFFLLGVLCSQCDYGPQRVKPFTPIAVRQASDSTEIIDVVFSPNESKLAVHLLKFKDPNFPFPFRKSDENLAGSQVQIWDIFSKKMLAQIDSDVPFHFPTWWNKTEDHLVTISRKPSIQFWDSKTGFLFSSVDLEENIYALEASIVSSDGSFLAVRGRRSGPGPVTTILLIDMQTGKLIHRFDESANLPFNGSMIFSHSGQALAALDEKGNISVFDTSTLQGKVYQLNHDTTQRPVRLLSFLPDEDRILIGSSEPSSLTLATFRISTQTREHSMTFATAETESFSIVSKSGARVLIPSEYEDGNASTYHKLILWDATTGNILSTLEDTKNGFFREYSWAPSFIEDDRILLFSAIDRDEASKKYDRSRIEIWSDSLDSPLVAFLNDEGINGIAQVSDRGRRAAMILEEKIELYDIAGI